MTQIQELDKQEEDGNVKLFYQTIIYKSTLNKIKKIFNKHGKFLDDSPGKLTRGGFQTPNIINLFNDEILKEIIPFNDFYKKCFWIHYIKYRKGGFQLRHDHKETENYSFILYLNDSDGNTYFEDPINLSIAPKEGRLVVFDASIIHSAEKSFSNKEILVGAVDKVCHI
jgi:hypothetical protein